MMSVPGGGWGMTLGPLGQMGVEKGMGGGGSMLAPHGNLAPPPQGGVGGGGGNPAMGNQPAPPAYAPALGTVTGGVGKDGSGTPYAGQVTPTGSGAVTFAQPAVAPSPVGGNDAQQAAAKMLGAIGNNQLIEPEFVDTLRRGEIPGLGKINRRAFYSLPLEQQQALIGAWLSTNQASSGESITRQIDQNTPASLGG